MERYEFSNRLLQERQEIYNKIIRNEKVDINSFAKWMRLNPTYAEKCVHKILNSFKERHFRQFVIEPYIVDFIFRKYKLIVEIDGPSHDLTKEYDNSRDYFLKNKGYYILHLSAFDAYNNPELIHHIVRNKLDYLIKKKENKEL